MKRIFEHRNWLRVQMFLILFLIFLAGLSSGYVWRMNHELYPVKYTYTVSGEAAQEHDRKANYHGLFQGQPVLEDPLGWYFIRDGVRCPF